MSTQSERNNQLIKKALESLRQSQISLEQSQISLKRSEVRLSNANEIIRNNNFRLLRLLERQRIKINNPMYYKLEYSFQTPLSGKELNKSLIYFLRTHQQ